MLIATINPPTVLARTQTATPPGRSTDRSGSTKSRPASRETGSREQRPPMILFNPRLWAIVWLVMVVYGTLIPFRFQIIQYWNKFDTNGQALWHLASSPSWVHAQANDYSSLGIPAWVNDLWVNLVLYAPAGFLMRWDAWRRDRSRLIQILVPIAVVLAMSWGAECAQTLLKGRVSSVIDILANVAGGALGVFLAPLIGRLAFGYLSRVRRWTHLRLGSACLDFIPVLRGRGWMVAVALLAVLVIHEESFALSAAHRELGPDVVCRLPFVKYFECSYDVAAIQLGQAFLSYILVATMVLVVMACRNAACRVWLTILATSLLAIGHEAAQLRLSASPVDATEPVIGGLAATAVAAVWWALFLPTSDADFPAASPRRPTMTNRPAMDRRCVLS